MQHFVIWQQNVNKSRICQHNLISNNELVRKGINIIALQEPTIDANGYTLASKDWTTIYPTLHRKTDEGTRAVTLIRSSIKSDSWRQLDFPSNDVTVIQINGEWGKLTIVNVYNDCHNDETIRLLTDFHSRNRSELTQVNRNMAHVLWMGDFNRHHPYWDDPRDTRLFTGDSAEAAEKLIEALADTGLELALPSGIPTHKHNVTKRWSRLDQVFVSDHSENIVTSCDTQPDHWGINTDHLPILTVLNLKADIVEDAEIPNFRSVDWGDFRKELSAKLAKLAPPAPIANQRQLDESCASLTKAIQYTIEAQVPVTELTSKSKRWWTKELTQLRQSTNKLGRQAYNRRHDPEHAIHRAHVAAVKNYRKILEQTKRQHWRDWLEKAEDPDIWTAHRLITSQGSDGGKARIPALIYKVGDSEKTASTNKEKGNILAKGFFPTKPPNDNALADAKYPKACSRAGKITPEQVSAQLKKLKPYKAPGPDGIPNVVLTKCADIIAVRLSHIYVALLEEKLSYKPWKEFTTIVLRKPGKPRYDAPKAYRPIALLNTMWKVITAIVASHITFVTEKHQLLPANHFGGRPGRTTTDAMHLLVNKIKAAWRAGKVTSVLFLDIEGAFPNANPERLVHNLRKRKVPEKYANFVHNMLRDRVTTLKFDGYVSDPIAIDNGIGQGDPLSMVLYQYYNADLLDIPSGKDEEAVAYVDDAFMMATGTDFQNAHRALADMMCKEGGVEDWSKTHSSPLEYTKLALMNFAHSCKKSNSPSLHLPRRSIQPVDSAKYLGVIFDRNLNWKVQQAHAVEKGTKWTAQIRRLARPTWGITPKYARRLYTSVALPRMLYAIDVWYAPSSLEHSESRAIGTAKVTKQVGTIQRAGALAITGGLRTSPTDVLNAGAYLLPAPLMINKWCHRAYTRMAMLPKEHPLYKPVNWKRTRATMRHRGPLHKLTNSYNIDTSNVEKIPAVARDPTRTGKLPFRINIPEDKESSVRAAENANEVIQVFTDGSAQEGKVGAAAILIRRNRPDRILHFHLGPEAEHTVHEAEMVGLLLAIHLISTENRAAKTCSIAVDNQAAIRAFDSDLRRPGHHLAREVLKIANRLQKRKNMRGYKLTIRWAAGHSGIVGNERADTEAKKAASGKQSDIKHLPAYLRKPLLINPAALKRSHGDALKMRWKADWTTSVRGKKMLHTDSTTPSTKFLRTISSPNLSRNEASKIAQLRLGHIPLNEYLHRFKRVDKANCPACGADVESITHFLLNCPMYAHERWALARQVRSMRKNMTLATLLGEPELAAPLAKYIHSTGRFKFNEGEQTHTTNNNTAQVPHDR